MGTEPEGRATPACEHTQEQVLQLLQGRISKQEQAQLRAHLSTCQACKLAYAETLSTVAELSRATRRAREREGLQPDQQQTAAALYQARGPVSASLARGGRVPMRVGLLVLALALCISVVVVARRSQRALDVRWIAGSSLAGIQELGPEHPLSKVGKGQWIATREAGRVELRCPGLEIQLAENSSLQVVSSVPPNLRLQSGKLRFQGSGIVSTPLGVLELEDASGSAGFSKEGCQVHCEQGRIQLIGPRNSLQLAAGDEVLLGTDGRAGTAP